MPQSLIIWHNLLLSDNNAPNHIFHPPPDLLPSLQYDLSKGSPINNIYNFQCIIKYRKDANLIKTLKFIDNKYIIEKDINISVIKNFQKFTVDRLGNIVRIKKETERFSNKLKSNKQRMAERKARREKLEQEKQQQTEIL